MRGVKVTFLQIEPILAALQQRAYQLLTTHPHILEVGLFGSWVRGDYAPGSDADLLIILDTDSRRFIDRIAEFLSYVSGLGIAVDVFPYTLEEIARMSADRFVNTALRERQVLAQRSGGPAQGRIALQS